MASLVAGVPPASSSVPPKPSPSTTSCQATSTEHAPSLVLTPAEPTSPSFSPISATPPSPRPVAQQPIVVPRPPAQQKSPASRRSFTLSTLAIFTPERVEILILFLGIIFALSYSIGKSDIQGGCAAGFGGSFIVSKIARRTRNCYRTWRNLGDAGMAVPSRLGDLERGLG